MERRPSTDVAGRPFSEPIIEAVWHHVVGGLGDSRYKKDFCGATISRDEYGLESEYGWEIDHIVPVSEGGTDRMTNLQALHWENNRTKGENYPKWVCKRI
jgi:5-methylcytosine-specific restriction endonuclease McrA